MDFLLLMGTNSLAGFPGEWKRNLLAATLGGAYGGGCLLPGFRFLGSTFWRVVFLVLMASLAFGWNRGSVKRTGVFVLLSMALGGIAMGFSRGSFWALGLAAMGLWILCRVAFGGRVGEQSYVPVTIRHENRQIQVLALRDTGNTLRDPVTGEPVLVLSGDVACDLTGLTREQLASPLETIAQRPCPGLRLIPYRAVGQEGGMLLAMSFPEVRVGNHTHRAVVAFDPGGLGGQTMYQALTGGVL